MAIAALVLFIGGVLGLRFKILILFPATILTIVVAGSIEIAQGQDAWSSALTTLAAVSAIQMGYLGGVAAGFVADRDVMISQKALDRAPLGFVEWFSRFIHP
jgi:hypothetical protein